MIRLAASEGADQGIDPARLAVGGDSAGANLALAAALALRDAGETRAALQLLIYGVYSTDSESPSWQRFGRGAGLSQTQMRWIWETYLETPDQGSDWRAAPLLADLEGTAAGASDRRQPRPAARRQQPSRRASEGRWRAAHELTVYQGINHGFIRYGRLIATARRAVGDCAAALRSGFAAAG